MYEYLSACYFSLLLDSVLSLILKYSDSIQASWCIQEQSVERLKIIYTSLEER